MDRRDLLKYGAMAGLATAAGLGGRRELQASMARGDRPGGRQARNIIFLAYDGTGYEDLATADFFARRVVGRPLRFHDLARKGQAGSMVPASLTSWVTDSSAASSAWSTGRRIVNAQVSQYPDGRDLTTIMELARGQGKATGLVTSARITHATPAAWVAKAAHRDMEDLIAEQYLASGTDVLLGGGRGPFDPATRLDRRDLAGEFRAAGYDVVTTAEELERSTASKVLGTFTPALQHLPYEVDRRFQGHPAPSLAVLTREALRRLDGAAGGFVLQVEAGRPDHANHNNDPGGLVWDWMAADEALEVILDFVDARDDTLLVFACDHDTGGSVAYGWGSGYRNTDPGLLTLGGIRSSYEWLLREVLPRRPEPSVVQEVARQYLGLTVDDQQAWQVASVLAGFAPEGVRWGHRNAHGSGRNIQMAGILSTSPSGDPDRPGISFATSNHTAGFVPVMIYGAGVPAGNLGIVDNTDLFEVMTGVLGVDFQNPLMTEEEARRLAEG